MITNSLSLFELVGLEMDRLMFSLRVSILNEKNDIVRIRGRTSKQTFVLDLVSSNCQQRIDRPSVWKDWMTREVID